MVPDSSFGPWTYLETEALTVKPKLLDEKLFSSDISDRSPLFKTHKYLSVIFLFEECSQICHAQDCGGI